jgi:site-specific recombinase XerC
VLLAGGRTAAFWVSQYGQALSYSGISRRLAAMTARHVGKTLRAHRFRHAIGSFVAIETPEHARAIPALLGNSLAASERYYIHGQRLAAARRHADLIADLRRETRSAQAETTATTEDR